MAWRVWTIGVLFGLVACGDDDDAGARASDAMVDAAAAADAGVPADARVPPDPRVDAGPAADARVPLDHDAAVGDASAPRASWLIAPGDRVFFVGNSFFNWEDRRLAEWVEAIGQAVEPKFPIETGEHNQPGVMPLSWFFEQEASQQAIASGSYDMFILQGEEMEPVQDKQGFHEAVRAYHQAITAKGGKVMLFMTWDFAWNGGPDSAFLEKLSAAYDEIGQELNVPVIPVGIIYNDAVKSPFPGEDPWFLNGGDLHQVASGSAINAYATFSMLTGVDAMGVVFDASNNDNTPEMLRYCSEKSWPRVLERLRQ